MRVTIFATLALMFAASLSGCAVPPAVSAVSALLDGISYVSTQKSVNDHVLSEVTQKDCAVWRVVKDEKICREYANGEQGLLATAADALEDEFSEHGESTVVEAKPVGQISTIDPDGANDRTLGQ